MTQKKPKSRAVEAGTNRRQDQLFSLLDKLEDAVASGSVRQQVSPLLDDLTRHALSSFQQEEQTMQERRCPSLKRHRVEHRHLESQLSECAEKYRIGRTELDDATLSLLRGCLTQHTLLSDQRDARFLDARG